MYCKQSSYVNFRNIEKQTLTFENGVNLIYGNNAQGKTNALEGIFLCAQGRSNRCSKEKDFIKFGSDHALVEIQYADKIRDDCSLYIKYLSNGRKHCAKNGVPLSKMSAFIGNFRAILFTPEHLAIVKSGPGERRHFIDCALSQLYPSYLVSLQNYARILVQRNKLLSDFHSDFSAFRDTLCLWSENLAAECERISRAREEYISSLSALARDIFSDMTSGREVLDITYGLSKSKEEYLRLLTENIDTELKYKTTLYGIHKDDIDIKINNNKARIFASQGQQRSASLAMKLSEGEISKTICGEYPVFLFDDILSELDPSRKDYIMHGILGRQVIITACEDIGASLAKGAKKIYCQNGKFYE